MMLVNCTKTFARIQFPGALACVLAVSALQATAGAQEILWLKQYGTPAGEFTYAMASDGAGGSYSCGSTNGALWGPYLGGGDGWLARLGPDGNPIWGIQIGNSGQQFDRATDVAADAVGGCYVGGDTFSKLGAQKFGEMDAWVAHYDANGTKLWLAQFGTLSWDELDAVAPSTDGSLYCAGVTNSNFGGPPAGKYDSWVAHLSATGQVLWKRQLGTVEDDWVSAAVSDGSGGVFVAGWTDGDLAGPNLGYSDAWIARYDSLGNQLWLKQLGGPGGDAWSDMISDGIGGAVLVGDFDDAPGYGVIGRYDASGNPTWLHPSASTPWAFPRKITTDGGNGYFVCGRAIGGYGGPALGFDDIFVSRYDVNGSELWVKKFGTVDFESASAICANGTGGVLVGGRAASDLGGQGSGDLWFAQVDGSCGIGPNYCSPSLTSITGCQATLSASGSPQASMLAPFTIVTSAVPGGNFGICLFGANGPANLSFGSLGGALCVAAPFVRTPPKPSGGSIGECDGSYSFTIQDLAAAAPLFAPGAVIDVQVWARDPYNQDGFLLSDGLELTVCP